MFDTVFLEKTKHLKCTFRIVFCQKSLQVRLPKRKFVESENVVKKLSEITRIP